MKTFILYASTIFLSLGVVSCGDSTTSKQVAKSLTNFEKLVQYCKVKKQHISQYKTIVVINEIGTCINCNNLFSKGQSQNLNADSTLFIVSGIGNKVDISAYVDNNAPNLIYDDVAGFDSLNIVKSSAVISLIKNNIRSIEEINVQNVHGLAEKKF